jgi:phenol 2-monooxygenase
VHYPPKVVDVQDPFILLVHQGMVEDVFLQDLRTRNVEVVRNRKFISQAKSKSEAGILVVESEHPVTRERSSFLTEYLVGCDGAHSMVRRSISGVEMTGEPSKAAWGVLDGQFDLHFLP